MITLSHLPGDRNGFKFFLADPKSPSVSGFSKAAVRALGDQSVKFAQQMLAILQLSSNESSSHATQQQYQQQNNNNQ